MESQDRSKLPLPKLRGNRKSLPQHANTRFQQWYCSLSADEKRSLSVSLGIGCSHLKSNYFRRLRPDIFDLELPTRCRPKLSLMKKFAEHTDGYVSLEQIRDHFYPLK